MSTAGKTQRPLMTPEDVAVNLGIAGLVQNSKAAVLKMVRQGRLVGVRVGRRVMIHPDSVDRLRGEV